MHPLDRYEFLKDESDFMSFLQWAKKIVTQITARQALHACMPAGKQAAFLKGIPEPEDDLARSYAQYRCQMKLSGRGMQVAYQLASIPLLLIYRYRYAARQKRAVSSADAVFLYADTSAILPETLHAEFPQLVQVRGFQQQGLLLPEDIAFLHEMKRRYPVSFYFRFKCMVKLAMYRYWFEAYHPKVMIVSEEYSYTSSFLTAYCHRLGVEHINVMHGEKLYSIQDSFVHFDRFYVWDVFYRDLFISLRAEPAQFRVELPPSMQPWNADGVEKSVDYTYYLQAEDRAMLEKIAQALHTLRQQGCTVAVRPHPRYSDRNEICALFSGIEVENGSEISIQTSILRTRHVISRFSTVLYQAYINHVPIDIDDRTDPEEFRQLAELRYQMLSVPHALLSELMEKAEIRR